MQHPKMGKRAWGKWLLVGVAASGTVVLLFLLCVSWVIGSSVNAMCATATREYGGDCVSALMKYVESPAHSLRDRNRAVWALGHLGDVRALPLLEKHYTGEPCDHSRMLCQHELDKAIELCRGGANLPALVWRHGSSRN
jgi:hypothetical protein